MGHSDQQKQTKEFFEKHALEWYENAKSDSKTNVNVVGLRNQFVEDMCSKYLKKNAKTLDAGCGTGDLVISLLKNGFDSYGVDFAASMIERAQIDANLANFSSDRFSVNSILDYYSDFKFDLISANGLIEYLSVDEYDGFVKKSYELLGKNGIVTIESRNRLFNVFSFNKYTEAEINLGQINYLIEEAIIFNNAKSINELLTNGFKVKLDKNLHQHELTGNEFINIKVDKRFQYTPFQLISKLVGHGFTILDLRPIHLHGLTTGAKSIDPEAHTMASYFLQDRKNVHLNIIPQASSFMIAARKA